MAKQPTAHSQTRVLATVVSVDAPVETLWDLTIDVAKLPDVTGRFKRIELLSDDAIGVGSQVRIWQPGALSQVWTVESLDEPTEFSWSTRVGPVRLLGVHELTPADKNRSELCLRVEISGFGAGVMVKVLGRRIQASIDQEAADFVAYLSSATHGR